MYMYRRSGEWNPEAPNYVIAGATLWQCLLSDSVCLDSIQHLFTFGIIIYVQVAEKDQVEGSK